MADIDIYNDLKQRFERLNDADIEYFKKLDNGFGLIMQLNSHKYYMATRKLIANNGENTDNESLKVFANNVEELSNIAGIANLSGIVGAIPVIGTALSVITSLVGVVDVIDAINDSAAAREKLRPLWVGNTPYQNIPVTTSDGKPFLSPTVKTRVLKNIEEIKGQRPKCRAIFSQNCKNEHIRYIKEVEIFITGVRVYIDTIHIFKDLESVKTLAKAWQNNPFEPVNSSGTGSPSKTKKSLVPLLLLAASPFLIKS